MKKLLQFLTLASACLLGVCTWAAEPVAVWDGDFDTATQGTYTLSLNENTLAEDGTSFTIKEGATAGVNFARSATDSSKNFSLTVILQGSNFPTAKDDENDIAHYVLSYWSPQNTTTSAGAGVMGCALYNGVFRSIFAHGTYALTGTTHDTLGTVELEDGIKTLVVKIRATTSNPGSCVSDLIADENGDRAKRELYSTTALTSRWTYGGIMVGGVYPGSTSTTLLTSEGLTINRIAIFEEDVSDADVLSYLFPSEVNAERVLTLGTTGETTTVNLTKTANAWSNGWVPTNGIVKMVVNGDVSLVVDKEVAYETVTVEGDGTLTITVAEGGSFTATTTQVFGNLDVASQAVTLGAVTVAANKTLAVGKDTTFTLTANNGTLHIASGTADDHLTLTQTSSLLLNKLTIAAGATVQVDNATGGNPKYQVSGEGASSVLILKNTTNTGVDKDSSFSDLTLQIPSGANKLWLNGGTVKTTGVGVALDMNAEVQLEQGDLTIASLAGDGTLVTDGGTRTVTITEGADAEFRGSFGAYKLVKQGTGTQTLSNTSADAFTGGVDVEAGTLKVTTATALGSGAVTVKAGATLALFCEVTNAITVEEGGTVKAFVTDYLTRTEPFVLSVTGEGHVDFTDGAGNEIEAIYGRVTSTDSGVTYTPSGLEVYTMSSTGGFHQRTFTSDSDNTVTKPWQAFCSANTENFTTPLGLHLTTGIAEGSRGASIGFAPLTIGALLVDKNASGYAFTKDNSARNLELGWSGYETTSIFHESVAFNFTAYPSGFTHTFKFYGNVTLALDEGVVLTLGTEGTTDATYGFADDNASLTITGQGQVDLNGQTFSFAGKTLDLSQYDVGTENMPFKGSVSFDGTTTLKVPAMTLGEGESYAFRLTDAATAVTIGMDHFYVGGEHVPGAIVTLSETGVLSYTISEDLCVFTPTTAVDGVYAWNDTTNWRYGRLPDATKVVEIDTTTSLTIQLPDAAVAIKHLTLLSTQAVTAETELPTVTFLSGGEATTLTLSNPDHPDDANLVVDLSADFSAFPATLGKVMIARGVALKTRTLDTADVTVTGSIEASAKVTLTTPTETVVTKPGLELILDAPTTGEGLADVTIDPEGGAIQIGGKYTAFALANGSATATDMLFENTDIVVEDASSNSATQFGFGEGHATIGEGATIQALNMRVGDGATGVNAIVTQTGGTVTLTATGTGTSDHKTVPLLIGSWNNVTATYNLQGGTLDASNGGLYFSKGTSAVSALHISGGELKVKGIAGNTGSHTMTLSGGRLSLGSSGITAMNNMNGITFSGGALVATATATVAEPMDVPAEGDTALASTFAAVDAQTLTVNTLTGAGEVVIGTATETGTVIFADATGYTGLLAMEGGMATVTTTGILTVQAGKEAGLTVLSGTVCFVLSAEQVLSGYTPSGLTLGDGVQVTYGMLNDAGEVEEVLGGVDPETHAFLPARIISINFLGNNDAKTVFDAETETAYGIDDYSVVKDAWNCVQDQKSGVTLTTYSVGPTVKTWSATETAPAITSYAGNEYGWDGATGLLRGYLDDATTPTVTINNIPFERYDVIIYRGSDNPASTFQPVSVNGQNYTAPATAGEPAQLGSVAYGAGGLASPAWAAATVGSTKTGNTLRIADLRTTTLQVSGNTKSSQTRGHIAAIQIVEHLQRAKVVSADETLADANGLTKIGKIAEGVTLTVTAGTVNFVEGAEIGTGVTIVAEPGASIDLSNVTTEITLKVDVSHALEGSVSPFTAIPEGTTIEQVGEFLFSDFFTFDPATGAVSEREITIPDYPIRWLPIGDSITEGQASFTGTSGGGYRYYLWNLLDGTNGETLTAGVNKFDVRTVGLYTGHSGTKENETGVDWAWHAGLYQGTVVPREGKRGAQVLNVETTLEHAGYPEIITVLLGVNDLNFVGGDILFPQWEAYVASILVARPQSKVVVSTLLPCNATTEGPRVPVFNECLRARATAAEKTGIFANPNLIFVDVAEKAFGDKFTGSGVDFCVNDNYHPNVSGSQKVAKVLRMGILEAIQKLSTDALAIAQVHNGTSTASEQKIVVRLNRQPTFTKATLKIAEVELTTTVVDATDPCCITFTIPDGKSVPVGTAEASLTLDSGTPIVAKNQVGQLPVVEILGSGAEANVPAMYREGYTKYQTVAITSELADGYGDVTEATEDFATNFAGKTPLRVGYYMELKRDGKPAQFVWVSMDPFNETLAEMGFPVEGNSAHAQKVANLRVYGNRGYFTNTEATAMGVEGIVEFTPGGYTATDKSTLGVSEAVSGQFGWNDTLTADIVSALASYGGCMQVARVNTTPSSVTEGVAYVPPAEMLFAYNNFRNSARYSDVGIGSLSVNRNKSGVNKNAVYDWSGFSSTFDYTAYKPSFYTVKSIEVWVQTAIATVNGMPYGTLFEAVEAAGADGVVTIVGTVSVDTLDLSNGAALAFDTGASLTVKHLKVGAHRDFVTAEDKAKLTVTEQVTLEEGPVEGSPIAVTWTMGENVKVSIIPLNHVVDAEKNPILTNQGTGATVSVETDGIHFPTSLHGRGAWYEYLFENTLVHSGRETNQNVELNLVNGTEPVYEAVGTTGRHAVRLAPVKFWTPGTGETFLQFSTLTDYTFSLFARMPSKPGSVFISFGKVDGGSGTLALVTGTETDEVLLVYVANNENTYTEVLARMTVPYAESTYHLYTFVRYADRLVIYLDKTKWSTYEGEVSLSNGGFQMGSIYGGFVNMSTMRKTIKLADGNTLIMIDAAENSGDTTPAAIDMLRLYDCELTEAEAMRIADEEGYAYSSLYGETTRTLSADTVTDQATYWNVADAWTETNKDGSTESVAEPEHGSVILTNETSGMVTVTLNNTATRIFENLTLEGSAIVLEAPANAFPNHLTVTGLTEVKTDVTIDCASITLEGAVRVADGKTLTLKISPTILTTMAGDVLKNAEKVTRSLTGLLTLGTGAKVDLQMPTEDSMPAEWNLTAAADSATKTYLVSLEHNPWYVEVDGTTATWKVLVPGKDEPQPLGRDTETVSAVVKNLAGAPVTIVGSGSFTLPGGKTPKVTIQGDIEFSLTTTETDTTVTTDATETIVVPPTTIAALSGSGTATIVETSVFAMPIDNTLMLRVAADQTLTLQDAAAQTIGDGKLMLLSTTARLVAPNGRLTAEKFTHPTGYTLKTPDIGTAETTYSLRRKGFMLIIK